MSTEAYIFEITKQTPSSGQERKTSVITYYAQRINDDLHGRIIPEDVVDADSPEKLAEKLREWLGGRERNNRLELRYSSVREEEERMGVVSPYAQDLDHEEEVRFQLAFSPKC